MALITSGCGLKLTYAWPGTPIRDTSCLLQPAKKLSHVCGLDHAGRRASADDGWCSPELLAAAGGRLAAAAAADLWSAGCLGYYIWEDGAEVIRAIMLEGSPYFTVGRVLHLGGRVRGCGVETRQAGRQARRR